MTELPSDGAPGLAGAAVPSAEAVDEFLPPAVPDWGDLRLGDDPRFAGLLPRGGTARQLIADASTLAPNSLAQVFPELAERVRVASSLTLEQEAEALVDCVTKRTAVILERYGLAGEPPATLDTVGRRADLTRERVRQITKSATAAMASWDPWVPALDAAIELATTTTPSRTGELADSLKAAGLTSLTWTAEGLTSLAAFFGRRLDLVDGQAISGPAAFVDAASDLVSRTRRVSDANGAAHIDQLIDPTQPVQLPPGLVRHVLANAPTIHALADDWYWADHRPGRNRLVNVSRRLLSIQQPQSMADMTEGVARAYDFTRSTGAHGPRADIEMPPVSTVRALYASHPVFTVGADELIRCSAPMDEADIGPEKMALVGVLRAQPYPAMIRRELLEACVELGMSRDTASVFTSYAECIKKLGVNVWGLRGAHVPAEYVAGLEATAQQRRDELATERARRRAEAGRSAEPLAPPADA